MVHVREAPLSGVMIIDPDVFRDERGLFAESWNAKRYSESRIHADFVQDNFSLSKKGVLRGLHFQNPAAQGKLVSVLRGEVFDVVVDIRIGSPTFGKWYGEILSFANLRQIYLPPGFAHGFLVLSDQALFHYKCTQFYHKETEKTLLWNDPDIDIQWLMSNPIVSEKDRRGRFLKGFANSELF